MGPQEDHGTRDKTASRIEEKEGEAMSETRYKRKIVQFQMHRMHRNSDGYADFMIVLDSDGKMWSRPDGTDKWLEEPELPDYWPIAKAEEPA